MSNIYIVEPPTSGKVLLKTSVGDIDVELWSKEAPKACRNFVQLCMEGYYNGTIFHRIVKGFIVQGGDPTGTGTGGESIYGEPFKDEFHSRLRFSRRGLLAMANAGKDDNASQFFFTLSATPELQNNHTIFGKVSGETIFNMLKLEDALVDHDERPLYPQKVLKTEVLLNPFSDIVPRSVRSSTEPAVRKVKKDKAAGVKNFKLLSFGEEAEEDEEEVEVANKMYSGRSKSTHDVLNEPGLSSETVVVDVVEEYSGKHEPCDSEELDRIRKKLRTKENVEKEEKVDEDSVEEPYVLGQARQEERKKMVEGIRKEIREVKRDLQNVARKNEEEDKDAEGKDNKEKEHLHAAHIEEYEQEQEKYRLQKSRIPKKGQSREDFTLALLAKFKQKLASAQQKEEAEEKEDEINSDDEEEWLRHRLHFETPTPVLAKDASTKGDDWFDITDPRNPINKRRREDSKQSSSSSVSKNEKRSRK